MPTIISERNLILRLNLLLDVAGKRGVSTISTEIRLLRNEGVGECFWTPSAFGTESDPFRLTSFLDSL